MHERLPVHGFVLAGGKSSRMGRDKALMPFHGRPMVEVATGKLRAFCANVSIAGNRDDLEAFAPVTREHWVDVGPVAGIEAGLQASTQEWAMFIPVDVPLVPAGLLREWACSLIDATHRKGKRILVSCLSGPEEEPGAMQPSFCLLHRDCHPIVEEEVRKGTRRLKFLLREVAERMGVADLHIAEVKRFSGAIGPLAVNEEHWFLNVNTPEELARAEALSGSDISSSWKQ